MCARDPDRGYAYLEEPLQQSEPSYGYSVLARIMESTRHNVVVATNFDNAAAPQAPCAGGSGSNVPKPRPISMSATASNAQHVEILMYATGHWLPERWHDALSNLKPLLLVDKITTGDWDFSGVIEAAKKRNHPADEWLGLLAAVCAWTADASTLNE